MPPEARETRWGARLELGAVVVPLDDAVTGGFGSAVDAADTHTGTLREKQRIE